MIEIIESLGHKLVEFYPTYDSYSRKDWNEIYLSFKCEVCNITIYYYKIDKCYWIYENGKEYSRNDGQKFTIISQDNIHEQLKCNEWVIKKLLE